VGKKCHACGKEVPEAHKGKCPHCGKAEGYAITRVINETITINDFITTEKNSMKNALNDAYLRFDNLEKKYLDNQKMLENIKIKRKRLEDQEKTLMKAVEDSAKFDFESAKKSTGIKSFTIDTILVTEDQKKILELENKLRAKEKVEQKLIDIASDVSDIKVKLGIKQTIGIGVLASFVGSAMFAIWILLGEYISANPSFLNFTSP